MEFNLVAGGLVKPLSEYATQKRRSGALYVRLDCFACKYRKEGRVPDRAYHRSYYYAHQLDFRYKAYRHRDGVLGRETLDRDSAVVLMRMPCFYCGILPSHGLDRIDNSLGHTQDNVRPCCEKCNYVLGDLPDAAKLLMIPALMEIHRHGALELWKIPTKR